MEVVQQEMLIINNLNIEDNKMTPHFETSLEGNGIRVMYLSDNSEVSIIEMNVLELLHTIMLFY